MVKNHFRADLFSRTPSLRAVFGTNFRAILRNFCNFYLLREITRKLVRTKISTIKVLLHQRRGEATRGTQIHTCDSEKKDGPATWKCNKSNPTTSRKGQTVLFLFLSYAQFMVTVTVFT